MGTLWIEQFSAQLLQFIQGDKPVLEEEEIGHGKDVSSFRTYFLTCNRAWTVSHGAGRRGGPATQGTDQTRSEIPALVAQKMHVVLFQTCHV